MLKHLPMIRFPCLTSLVFLKPHHSLSLTPISVTTTLMSIQLTTGTSDQERGEEEEEDSTVTTHLPARSTLSRFKSMTSKTLREELRVLPAPLPTLLLKTILRLLCQNSDLVVKSADDSVKRWEASVKLIVTEDAEEVLTSTLQTSSVNLESKMNMRVAMFSKPTDKETQVWAMILNVCPRTTFKRIQIFAFIDQSRATLLNNYFAILYLCPKTL